MTASRLRAAALYEPLTQHSSADIFSFENRSFNILSEVYLYKKDIFAWMLQIGKYFRQGTVTADCKNVDFLT